MNKKRLTALSAILLAVAIPVTAFGYTYSSISLPMFSGNWSSPNRTKTTADAYFSHNVTSMGGGYGYVNAWETNAVIGDLTPKVTHHVGDASQKVYFKNVNNGISGIIVNLMLENNTATYVAVEAAGSYDVR